MFKIIEFIAIGFVSGFLLATIIKKLLTIEMIKKNIPVLVNGIIDRFDKAVTGNDGCYSHTRIINIMWAFGGFILIAICTLRSIKIPNGTLVLMGSGMGIGMAQAVMNKKQEVKQVIAEGKEDAS